MLNQVSFGYRLLQLESGSDFTGQIYLTDGESNDLFLRVDMLNGEGKFDVLSTEWYSVSPDTYVSIAIATGEE